MHHTLPIMKMPFRKLLDGSKTIDVRLYNDKYQKIRPNDIIEFDCRELNDKATFWVKGFLVFESANTMAEVLPPEIFGYDNKEEVRVRLNRLFLYEDQHKYGLIGIILDPIHEHIRDFEKGSFENAMLEQSIRQPRNGR